MLQTEADMGKSMSEAELMAELAVAYDDMQQRPGEITIMQFAEAQGIGRSAAREFLDARTKAGLLVKRQVGGRVYFSSPK